MLALAILLLGFISSVIVFCTTPVISNSWVNIPDLGPALDVLGTSALISFGIVAIPCVIPATRYLQNWWKKAATRSRIMIYITIAAFLFLLLFVWNGSLSY